MKNFFKMVKLETMRVTRNKMVMFLLLVFSITMLVTLYFIQSTQVSLPVAIYVSTEEQSPIIDELFTKFDNTVRVDVESFDEGRNLILNSKVIMFIHVEEKDGLPVANVYYDSSSYVGNNIKSGIENQKTQIAYDTIVKFLGDAVTVKESYFEQIQTKPINGFALTPQQMPFFIEICICISIILMFGLTYSTSRDNETNVSRNLKYMPLNIHSYIWSKIIPYLLLGVIQILLLLLFGQLAFGIQFQINILVILLFGALFVLSCAMLGFVFSMNKSQISAIFFSMISLLLPLFCFSIVFFEVLPIPFKILFDLLPVSVFIQLGNAMAFSGVIIWKFVLMLIIQIVIYYLLSIIILKKRNSR